MARDPLAPFHPVVQAFVDDLEAGLTGKETAIIYEQSMNSGFGQSCRGYYLLTFLGYPAPLAPADRLPRYYALYQQIAQHHTAKNPLSPDELAWAAVCAALIQHPEAGLY